MRFDFKHCDNLSLSTKKRKRREPTQKQLEALKKGQKTLHLYGFKKGNIPWNKGLKLTDKHKRHLKNIKRNRDEKGRYEKNIT